CYLRLGRGGEKQIHYTIENFEIGKAIKIKDGEKVAVFSTGAIFDEVDEACKSLEKEGFVPTVYTFPTVKPIDKDTILQCASKYDTIITVEEHNLSGGFGSAVAEVLAEETGVKAKLVRVALDDRYSCIVGSQKYLRQQYSIDAKTIIEKVKENY
ncbi:MAG: transketolase, partial [Clostridia bacterium]|nr:transketolase [Clostridia bacterium]